MAQLPGWMPILLDRIQWGCSTSPWFVNLADESKIFQTGRSICLELWPFIRELPINIAFVRDAIPETENMQAARNLLSQLSDDERHYQKLFLAQCYVGGGLTEEELCTSEPTAEAVELTEVMRRMCRESNYVDGVHAIVAAELAATLYSRAALPIYERYFEKHLDRSKEELEHGLAWLRLHAKPHTRHALWMKRMLGDLEDSCGNEIPRAADMLLNCVLKLWHCPPEETRATVGASTT